MHYDLKTRKMMNRILHCCSSQTSPHCLLSFNLLTIAYSMTQFNSAFFKDTFTGNMNPLPLELASSGPVQFSNDKNKKTVVFKRTTKRKREDKLHQSRGQKVP